MKRVSFVFALVILCTTRTPSYAQSAPLPSSRTNAQAISPSAATTFAAAFSVTTYKEPPPSPVFTATKVGSFEKNVTYCVTADGVDLKLDIFFPAVVSAQKYPLVVFVHGGGLTGVYSGQSAMGPTSEIGVTGTNVSDYTMRGFAFASVNYRLGPHDKLPTMIEDAKCAIRYLRARAGSYNINPDRIGVFGPSSGGYLVSMLGLADASAGFEGLGAFSGVSSRVQAVVSWYPQVSFELPSFSDAETNSRDAVVPAGSNAQFLHDVSLPTYVSPDDPPFLFLHGEFDPALSPKYSLDLNARLVAAGVDSTYVLVKGAGHGWRETDPRLPNTPYGPEPTRQEILKQVLAFFDKHLKK